jgi:WD40 repeat protein
MKTRILPIVPVGFFLTLFCGWNAAAPVLPAGRPKEIVSFQAHPFDVSCLAFSPDGKTVASGGLGELGTSGYRVGRVKLWDAASGKSLLNILAHEGDGGVRSGNVRGIAFSHDGKTLASAGDDRKLNLWNVATGKNNDSIHVSVFPPLLFSPDGKSLVCGEHRLNLTTRKYLPVVEGPPVGIWPVIAFTPKGKLLLGMTDVDSLSFAVWDGETGKKILTSKGNRKLFLCAAFSPDGKMVVSTEGELRGRPWAIQLRDIASGKITATFEQPEIPYHPTFSPDGKVLAVACRHVPDRNDGPGSIRLFEVSSGKVLAMLKGYKRVPNCLAFSPDGRLLATGSLDGVLKIWSLPKRYKAE